MTNPMSGVILTGAAISKITGKPVRYLWYGDVSNGLCRMDPEVDAVIPPTIAGGLPSPDGKTGIGGHQNNILTCIGSIKAAAFTPGQIAFDGSTNTLYTTDVGRTTAGIIRLHYDPNGDGGKGLLDPVTVTSLMGTTINRNAAGGCPQITDPKTGAKVPIVPDASAIGPDGNLYVGNIRDGAIIRIKGPATFDPSVDANCQNLIDIPILSADERVGAGHTFGLGWIGHTLLGNDNIAPWVMFNADQCLTPANGNRICGSPAVSGAPMPTEILASIVPGPQAAGTTDAQYPNFGGNTWFVATFPQATKISNITSTTNLNVQTGYGGTFSFITGLTADPLDLTNRSLYIGVDPTQGSINGAASIYQVVEQPPAPLPPLNPISATATANSTLGAVTGSASVTWVPQSNNQPITSYVVRTFLAPALPGGAPTASAVADVTVLPDPTSGALATTVTVSGLSFNTSYVFAVEACNAAGCSPFSAFSNVVTPTPVTVPPAPTGVSGLAGTLSVSLAWTQPGNGGSVITSSSITPFDVTAATALAPVVVVGSATGGTVSGLNSSHSYTFTVTASNAAGTSAPSLASAAVTPLPATTADMQVTMSAQASINAGSILTYTMTVTNLGPAAVNQAVLNDTMPAGATFSSSTTTQGACSSAVGTTSFSCNLGGMLPGASATVTLSVQLSATATGSATNTASVPVPTGLTDPNPANNSASASTTILSGGGGGGATADIQVTGSSNNGNPLHGTPVTYTWQIKNATGNVNVPGVTFTMSTVTPTSGTLTINSVSTTSGTCTFTNNPGTITCSLGTINGGQQAIVTVSATPTVAAPANSYQATGQASFSGTDTNTANNQFTVFIGAQ